MAAGIAHQRIIKSATSLSQQFSIGVDSGQGHGDKKIQVM